MSNLAIQSSQSVSPLTSNQPQIRPSASQHQLKDLATPEMAKDSVSIRKGLTPTLKGAAVGGLGMGGGVALLLKAEKLAIGTPFLNFGPYIVTAAAAGGLLAALLRLTSPKAREKAHLWAPVSALQPALLPSVFLPEAVVMRSLLQSSEQPLVQPQVLAVDSSARWSLSGSKIALT